MLTEKITTDAEASRQAKLGRVDDPRERAHAGRVDQRGEDLASGFKQAAGIYQARANYRTELILYCALPVAILFLGLLISGQLAPMVSMLLRFMDALSGP